MGQKWVQNDPFLTPYGYFNLTFFCVFLHFSALVLEKGSQKGSILTLSRPPGGIDFSHMMVKIDPPGGSMTPGGVIFGDQKMTLFWQNCGFKTTKIWEKGQKKGSKMTQKWPKNDPFLTPFLTTFLVLFWQFTGIKPTKKKWCKIKGGTQKWHFFDHFFSKTKSPKMTVFAKTN